MLMTYQGADSILLPIIVVNAIRKPQKVVLLIPLSLEKVCQ